MKDIKETKRKRKLVLEIDGQVSLVEYQGVSRISSTPIAGELVLDCVKVALTGGLDFLTMRLGKKKTSNRK